MFNIYWLIFIHFDLQEWVAPLWTKNFTNINQLQNIWHFIPQTNQLFNHVKKSSVFFFSNYISYFNHICLKKKGAPEPENKLLWRVMTRFEQLNILYTFKVPLVASLLLVSKFTTGFLFPSKTVQFLFIHHIILL